MLAPPGKHIPGKHLSGRSLQLLPLLAAVPLAFWKERKHSVMLLMLLALLFPVFYIHIYSKVLKCGYIYVTTRYRGLPYRGYLYDYWRYELGDMQKIFSDFESLILKRDPEISGVFPKSRRPLDWRLCDLSHIASTLPRSAGGLPTLYSWKTCLSLEGSC